jgi:hypothetical protein
MFALRCLQFELLAQLVHNRLVPVHNRLVLVHNRLVAVHNKLVLVHNRLVLAHNIVEFTITESCSVGK